MAESDIHHPEVIAGVITLVYSINALFWSILHVYRMYSDLYTIERKSVSHRRNKPKISYIYKLMTWTTTIAIVSFAWSIITTMLGNNFSTVKGECIFITILMAIAFQLAKPAMYLTYIVRVHQCYSQSAFGYGKKKLLGLAIFIIILGLILTITVIIGIITGGYSQHIDKDDQYPYTCTRTVPDTLIPILAGGIFIFDFIFGIGAIVAFIIPINRLIKTVKDTNNGVIDEKKYGKMLYAGVKYKVVVIVASISSIAWILITAVDASQLASATLSGIDFTINMFCLMMMTSYYPDDKYYQRLCCLCICCCDRNKKSYQSQASGKNKDDTNNKKKDIESTVTITVSDNISTNTTTSIASNTNLSSATSQQTATNTKSIDTMDAVQMVAQKEAPNNEQPNLINDNDQY